MSKGYTSHTYIRFRKFHFLPRVRIRYIQRALRVKRRGMSLCCYQARMKIQRSESRVVSHNQKEDNQAGVVRTSETFPAEFPRVGKT